MVVERRRLGRLEVQCQRELARAAGRDGLEGGEGGAEPVGAVRAGHRPGRPIEGGEVGGIDAGQGQIEATRRSVRVAGRAIDPLADLETLHIQEAVAGLVGDGEVRRPGRREAATLGPEDDVFEAELALRAVAGGAVEVPGVVPPLGQSVMRAVVARQHHGERIAGADRRVRGRRHGRERRGSHWPGSAGPPYSRRSPR